MELVIFILIVIVVVIIYKILNNIIDDLPYNIEKIKHNQKIKKVEKLIKSDNKEEAFLFLKIFTKNIICKRLQEII